jgi:hypothetical protein
MPLVARRFRWWLTDVAVGRLKQLLVGCYCRWQADVAIGRLMSPPPVD